MNIYQVCYKTRSWKGDGSRGNACNSYEYIKALSEEHALETAKKYFPKRDKYAHDFFVKCDCGEGNWYEKLHCLEIDFLKL